ncbi:MAG: hypothetical protein NDJ90_03775 [Oligoflexia bacterium]|nr:hypothetical protein [Oligoflexia bacterium]
MASNQVLDTVLLLALPASGKSEVRKFLAGLTAEQCRNEFHMGPTVQLDDYPYVHMMRRVDDELAAHNHKRVFFLAGDRPFQDPRDWGTLIELLNEDYADLQKHKKHEAKSAALWLMDRMDAAAAKAGIPARLKNLDSALRNAISDPLEPESRKLLDEKNETSLTDLNGKTIVIEFARGGADGSSLPLAAPFGYKYSLAQLSDEILSRSKILYVWVTPEESRRKNHERTDPNDPGSILNHGVPIEVMLKDYGTDDMTWLEEQSSRPGTVKVETRGKTVLLPISRFDNRVDKTSFVRGDRKNWDPVKNKTLHDGLAAAFQKLASMK